MPKHDEKHVTAASPRWEPPTLKFVGKVDDLFLFPGGGKVSVANYDPGDTPFKPKGQEPK